MDPVFNEIVATTLQEIYPELLVDQYFLAAPFTARLRARCQVEFGGGAFIQSPFLFAPMVNGPYALIGGTWNTDKGQTIAATTFQPKGYVAVIPEFTSELEVINKGELAVISLLDSDTRNAINSISARLAIELAYHGQASSSTIVGNRPLSVNGWSEGMNDGDNPSFDGSVFPNYGNQPRNGFVGSALNSTPIWGGTPTGGVAPVQYDTLESMYQTASIGNLQPDLIVANKGLYGAMKMRIQTMQRISQEKDPYWGVTGFKFNDAIVMKDDYFPSLKYGKNDPRIGNYLTGTFSVPASATAASGLPAATTTVTVGEVVAMFNMDSWAWRVSNSPIYGFGLGPFYAAQNSDKVVATIRAAVNLQGIAPRLNIHGYGFSSN